MSAQTLRPYQTAGLDALRAQIARGVRRLVFVLPTGGGKTSVAAEMIRCAVAKGGSVLFLAHRKELIDQASARLDGFGVPHGVVMAKHPREAPQLPVQVASVATLIRRMDRAPPATLIIVDECHHARASSYQTIIEHYPAAAVIGLSATPWRGDGKGLRKSFDGVVVAATVRELIDQGFLVPFDGFGYENPALEDIAVKAGDFDELQLAERMNTKTLVGGIVEQWQKHAVGKRTVAFAVNVAHSRSIVEAFVSAGVVAEHVDGETPKEDREAILARLASGETTVVSNCMVLSEGWDCPAVEVCILARPTKSLVIYLQQAGRVLRPAPGKTSARLHDHAGLMFRHGLPDEDRDYSLEADVQRKDLALGAGTQQCPECFRICATTDTRCSCGYVFEEPAAEIEDEEITYIDGPQLTVEELRKIRNATMLDKVAEYKRLLLLAQRLGNQPGWASHEYRRTYGVWPRFGTINIDLVDPARAPPLPLNRLRLLTAGAR